MECFAEQVQEHYGTYVDRELPDETLCLDWIEQVLAKAKEQKIMAEKFTRQLDQLLPEAWADQYQHLQTRVRAAHDFFIKSLDELNDAIKAHMTAMRIKPRSKKYTIALRELHENVMRKKLAVRQSLVIAEGLAAGGRFLYATCQIKRT